MPSATFLALVGFVNLFFGCTARITSLGLDTAASTRDKLPDSAFRINFTEGTFVQSQNWNFNITDPTRFPALAATDVQTTIALAFIKSGEMLFRHYHPRSAEVVIAIRGVFNVSFLFEGLGETRNVSNIINPREATVFPQGLIHDIRCVSSDDCLFYAILDSADPGLVETNV